MANIVDYATAASQGSNWRKAYVQSYSGIFGTEDRTKLPDTKKFSYDKAYQNQPIAGYTYEDQVRGAGKGSEKRTVRTPYYKIESGPQAPAPAPAPAPAANPAPELKITPENQAVRDRTDEILEAADARMADFLKAFQASNAAAEERARLAEEAAERRAAEAAALQRTSAANLYRAGQAQNLQIAPAGGAGAPQTASGTSGFRRRSSQFNPSAFSGLNTIASGMVNL